MSEIRIFLFFFFSCAPNGVLSNPNSANTCWWISHKGCMLICFAWYCIMSDVRQVRPVWWHWSTLIQCRVVSHVGLGGSGLAGQKLGKFVEGWTRDTQDSEGRTLGCPGDIPNRGDMSADTWLWGHQTKETCQAGTLDTVFQGFEKTAKTTLVFSLWSPRFPVRPTMWQTESYLQGTIFLHNQKNANAIALHRIFQPINSLCQS